MTNSTVAGLERQNDGLRQSVIRLGTIILRNAVETRELIETHGSETLQAAVMSTNTVARLREASLCCSQLSRAYHDSAATQVLESLGVELANEARSLELLLKIPGADE
jgi:hypothetical protein